MTEQTTSPADKATKWWRNLVEVGEAKTGAKRAARARLRRASTPLDIIQEQEALRLMSRLPGIHGDRVAILAGVLALVEQDTGDDRSVARAIGRDTIDDDSSALMSETRFRRLLQAEEDDLLDAMRRLVRLSKGAVNVRDLSFAILFWSDGVKKRWIFEYYNVADRAQTAPAATGASRTSSDD